VQETLIADVLYKVMPTITPEEREAFPRHRLEAVMASLPPGLLDDYLDKFLGPPERPEIAEITRRARAVRFVLEFLGVGAPPLDPAVQAADHERREAEFRVMFAEALEHRRAAQGEEPEPPTTTS